MRQPWVTQNNARITHHVDATIQAVGAATFDDLARNERGPAWYRINGAFRQLRLLIEGGMPIYDVWSALFYFLWYQPKQINVAYRIINSVRNGAPLVGNRRLHVIDLGCGALAMKFGVALALADTISRGKPAARVRIDSADVCAPMIQLGDDAWDTFVDRIAQDPAMGSLREACQLIDGASIVADAIDDFAQLVPRQDGAEVWLSALHTVYDENIRGVQEALAYLVDHFHPDLGIITSIDLRACLQSF